MGYLSKKLYKSQFTALTCYFYKMNYLHPDYTSFNLKQFLRGLLLALLLPFTVCAQNNQPPVVTATGNQVYCPGSINLITTAFNITDPDDTGLQAIYIQISSGYQNTEDVLSLNGTIPGLNASWSAAEGKLTISGTNGQNVLYADLINAVQNVVYTNTATNPTTGTRTFSITIGQANYLESTGHYYLYIPSQGINWNTARNAAEASTYYGWQGYLATILSADEAQLIGEQALGTGWIGGSDSQTEGVWRWVTGPEAGTVFWNGGVNGNTPNYAFWNTGEPNNSGDEDYAHITAPGVGVPGSWNDLPVNGSSGPYTPQGYIVEYGGMPGDQPLQISATTTMQVVAITGTTPGQACGSGPVTLQATVSGGIVRWYTSATGGTPVATGSSFTTPAITGSTTYYASAYNADCASGPRTPVIATINPLPTLTATTPQAICGSGTAQLQATPSAGTVSWYDAATGGNTIGTGNSITSPAISTTTTFYAEAVTTNGCVSAQRTPVTVTVNPIPTVTSNNSPVLCGPGTASLTATASSGTIQWFTAGTGGTLIGEGATITSPQVNQTTTFYAEAVTPQGCISATRVPVTVTINPDVTITTTQPEFYICEEGTATLEVTTDNPGATINWYDAETGGNLLAGGYIYTTPFLNADTIFYAEAVTPEGCVSDTRVTVSVIVAERPTITADSNAVTCTGSGAQLEAAPSAGTINWYTESTGGTPVGTGEFFTTPPLTEDTVYYAEAENNGCTSLTRQAVSVTVVPLPEALPDETVTFCENTTYELDAEIAEPVTYLWSTGETTASIDIAAAGVYTVTLTNANGCTDMQTFTATTLTVPQITTIRVNNTDEATVVMEDSSQAYEYSLDGINYKASPLFRGLKQGSYIAFARSLNGCGVDTRNFTILLVQPFFTPNNDTVNDVFSIAAMESYPDATVTVFDRYGKIITRLNRSNREWDGTYNGNRLPATDYWYVIQLDRFSPEIRGHVSLVR
jgi:gliding motility-associated-like protein